jgi:hypothetical protein
MSNITLYAGVYVDYGLLNVAPKKANSALVHRPTDILTDYSYNSMLTSMQPTGNYVDKVNLLAVGVKLRVGFGL